MAQECVFCGEWNRGVEFGCCETYVCNSCLSGDGWHRKGGGFIGGASQVMCPPCGVWVDV
jgi:hypothetical protein